MDAIQTLGMVTGIGTALAGAFDNSADKQQEYQLQLMKKQADYNNAAMNKQLAAQKEMYEYTGFGSKVRQLKEAGLNPGLIYGMGNAGGGVTGNSSALGVTGASAPNVSQSNQTKLQSVGMALELAKLKSEIDVNKSVAESNRATAGLNTEKTQTEPFNRFKTMVEEELLRYQANNEMRTQEARVNLVYQALENAFKQEKVLQSEADLKDEQIKEITQRIAQSAIKFDFDLNKTQAEIDKIVQETTNMDITSGQGKLIDVLKNIIPIIISTLKK